MTTTLQALHRTLPNWLEVIESDDGQYHVLDSSFDDGAMELARFQSEEQAVRFVVRLAEQRSGLLQQR